MLVTKNKEGLGDSLSEYINVDISREELQELIVSCITDKGIDVSEYQMEDLELPDEYNDTDPIGLKFKKCVARERETIFDGDI